MRKLIQTPTSISRVTEYREFNYHPFINFCLNSIRICLFLISVLISLVCCCLFFYYGFVWSINFYLLFFLSPFILFPCIILSLSFPGIMFRIFKTKTTKDIILLDRKTRRITHNGVKIASFYDVLEVNLVENNSDSMGKTFSIYLKFRDITTPPLFLNGMGMENREEEYRLRREAEDIAKFLEKRVVDKNSFDIWREERTAAKKRKKKRFFKRKI